MNSKLKASKLRLGGVKYWAQWMPYGRKPAYELFVYVGSDPDGGHHYFAHYKDPKLMVAKNWYQLTSDLSFRAFELNFAELDKYAKERGFI